MTAHSEESTGRGAQGESTEATLSPDVPGNAYPSVTDPDFPGKPFGQAMPVGGLGQPAAMRPLEPPFVLRIGLLVEGGLVLAAGAVSWLIGQPVWQKIHPNLWDALLGSLITLPLWAGLWWGVNYPRGPWRGLVRVLEDVVIPLFARCRVWHLGVISFLAGLGEEMLFRGLLQDGLADWLNHGFGLGETVGLWLAVGLASTLFGLLHWISPFYALLAGLIGAYLGWWRVQSGNLLGPIIAHALYDFAALVYLTKIYPRTSHRASCPNRGIV